MICLDCLAIINLYFGKSKALYKNLSAVLGEVPVINFLNEFF